MKMRGVGFLFNGVLLTMIAVAPVKARDSGHINILEGPGTAAAGQNVSSRNLDDQRGTMKIPARAIKVVTPGWPSPDPASQEPRHVVLSYVIKTDGSVTNVRVIKSGGSDYDENSLEALRQWSFRPATINGAPVGEEYRTVAFDFVP